MGPSPVTRILAALLIVASTALAADAGRLARDARRAERRGDDVEAFLLYTRAAGLDPRDARWRLHADRLRPRAAMSLAAMGRREQALSLEPEDGYLRARLTPPVQGADPPTEAEIRNAEQLAEPIDLAPRRGRRDIDFRGDPRSVWERLMRAWNLEAVFDTDYSAAQQVRLRSEERRVGKECRL